MSGFPSILLGFVSLELTVALSVNMSIFDCIFTDNINIFVYCRWVTPAMIQRLIAGKAEYEAVRHGKADLLRILDESELPEAVYNSNAIENSTLTLEETERILLSVEISRHMDLREVHEAQNLARVAEYIRSTHSVPLDLQKFLLLHTMLFSNIDADIAGRFRNAGEYVRVGTHVAPPPENIQGLLLAMLIAFESSHTKHIVKRIALLHLEFERIHPFNDGNGRIGRVLINYLLYREGFPPVIIRNKGKEKYYAMLRQYDGTGKSSQFESHLAVLMLESLHRRTTYLRGKEIVTVAALSKAQDVALNLLLNYARRQTIPAFRERGVWKIAADFRPPSQSDM
jgi:Fic family protein